MNTALSFNRLFAIGLWVAGGGTAFFLIVPLSFNAEPFFTYPMPGLSLRWYEEFFSSDV